MISFDASITGDKLDSAVQLPNFRSLVAWHTACMMHDTVYYYSKASFIDYVSQENT